MAKKESHFLVQQKMAVGAFSLVVICVIGYLTWLTFEDAPLGEFVEGEHYDLVDNPRRIRDDRVEVMEFFSYACVHCYNFDPDLTDWVEDQGDKVNFVRMPAVASDYWRALGRTYYTLERLDGLEGNHMAFFRAIHETRRNFPSADSLADFFASSTISPDEFKKTFNSAEVASDISKADQMARRLKVASVPTIIVQGKYIVRTTRAIGPKRMLEVMNYLVEKELAEQSKTVAE